MPAFVAHALAPGHELDDYRIDALLASGPFGLTYLAHDATISAPVVIREFLPISLAARGASGGIEPHFARHEATLRTAVTRFVEHAKGFAAVRHPHVVRVGRLFETSGTAYVVSDYESGMTLADWRRDAGRPSESSLVRLLVSALDGLQAIHDSGLVHQSLRPTKLRLRGDGTAIILPPSAGEHLLVDNGTDSRFEVTIGFSPIEGYSPSGNRGPWSDVYSLAAIAFWLLTGERPQDAPERVVDDRMRPLSTDPALSSLSKDVLKALDWSLAPKPEHRAPSAAALRRAIAPVPITTAQPRLVEPTRDAAATAAAAPRVPADQTSARAGPWSPNPELLAHAQADLAHYLGPIAGVIVKKSVTDASDWRDFCARAASQITDLSARTAFLERHSAQGTSHTEGEAPVSAPANVPSVQHGFEPPLLAGLEAELVGYLGAIARIVVKRAAGRSQTKSELYEQIAAELDDAARARKFVAWAESKYGLR